LSFTANLYEDQTMKPRIALITLGVAELAVRFYRDGPGLHTEGIGGQEFERCAEGGRDGSAGLAAGAAGGGVDGTGRLRLFHLR
jgi:hypothetical protein